MKIEIVLNKGVDLRNNVLIEGFPGIGLVGTIAAGYIVEKRGMVPAGYIISDRFPPMTTIHQGRPFFPARIYKDPKADFCVILSEFVVPALTVQELARDLLDFAKKNKIRQIVSLAGMTSTEDIEKPNVYAIVSNNEMERYIKTKNITLIKEGVTTGVSGVLIARCAVDNFPAASILVESKYGYPDPRAAAHLVQELDKVIGLKVDTKDLIKEAGRIEARMKNLLVEMKKHKDTYQQAESELPMFG